MKKYSNNIKKSVVCILLLAVSVFCMYPVKAIADEENDPCEKAEPISIYDYDDLLGIADNPGGYYRLENDIDCSGNIWEPVDFSGVFDGNNHALLNLKITNCSNGVRTTYDGNMIAYDTRFSGFFGILENAAVNNLIIKGIDVEVTSDFDCFVGTLAGYSFGSSIDECVVEGTASLTVSAKMMGVGGIVGYGGNGYINNSVADVTLICIDTDAANRDEQFMAGAYAAGFLDLDNDNITIDGYDSDHGYVHDGGLVGMYILYGDYMDYEGYITNSRSDGMITFFEDNTDRRAYCSEYIGEVMNWTYEWGGCSSGFVRNEVYDYSNNLLPHCCSGDDYSATVVQSTDSEYGYTLYTCNECGTYSYKADYTPLAHSVSEWSTVNEATNESAGLECGICDTCGTTVYRKTDILAEETQENVSVNEVADSVSDSAANDNVISDNTGENENKDSTLTVIVVVLISLTLASVVCVAVISNNKKKKRKKKKYRGKNNTIKRR